MTGFKNKNYLRIKKPSSIRNEKEAYQLEKIKGLQNLMSNHKNDDKGAEGDGSIYSKAKNPTVSFTTMRDAVNNAKNGRKDNLPNLNSSRPHYNALNSISLADKTSTPSNFAYPNKRAKADSMNMTSRGQSHIGFGSTETRGIG